MQALHNEIFDRSLHKIAATGGIPLRLELWDGRAFDLAPSPAVTVRVKGPEAIRYFIEPSMSGLGEAFVEGHIHVDGPIHEVFRAGAALALRGRGPGRGIAAKLFGHSRRVDRESIQHHYDVSNEFYALFLDSGMVYSCAYFRNATDALDAAQDQKLDHILKKLRLQPGETLLDIGCGWGALVLRAAKQYGALAKGITLSQKQYEFANEQIRKQGLVDRCVVALCDYRDLPSSESFDKIASVGMFEHVGLKNLPAYFGKVSSLLRPRGLFLNHGITSSDPDEFSVGAGAGDFIDRYVFPNGELPHLHRVVRAMSIAGFDVCDVESLRRHYAATCRMWADRLEARRERAAMLVGERRLRVWQIYLAGCAYGFEKAWINIHQVLGCKTDAGDAGGLPWTRDDIYETH